ncbi:MAG TPA: ATP-binding protein [Vicinamibacteria bacterium]|nr:ATP-binding protein [Vicinamibacteria bacterium]
MGDARRQSLRLAVGMALLVVGLVEIQAVLQAVRSERRLRDRVVGSVHEELLAALPPIRAALAKGGPESWDEAARLALATPLASEVEVFAESGRQLLSRPAAPPVGHWPGAVEQESLHSGKVLTVAAQSGPAARALTYVPFSADGRRLLLRLSTPVPDLEDDLRERQRLVIGHLIALSVLLLAGGLVLLPERSSRDAPAPRVLDAYEQAMHRLREQGQEMSREHQAERRRLEDEMQDKEAMARAGELTAGIVHEVRNGLGTILGYARLLERSPSAPEAAEAGPRIREECETLETVVRRFMDFVKSETVNRAPFDLGRMLSRVVAREVRGRPGVSTALEGVIEGGALLGDEELLERAFENLVRNAADAAGSGGHISVEVRREERTVTVTIADNGPGMLPERRRDVRPFVSSKPGGLGLGLPIAIKIVRLHGGDLVLGDSEPHGLRVRVILPSEAALP